LVGSVSSTPNGVVERYLECLVAHDWERLGTCLSAQVVRIGPFSDVYVGKESYLSFISDLMPTLQDYSMAVARIVALGNLVLAELSETMTIGGTPVTTQEALLFDLDDVGLIVRISIYIRRLDSEAPRRQGG
jgi:limonene-1,2-epoxide hydrolase